MDKTIEDKVQQSGLASSFVKDAMTVALSQGLSVPSLRHDGNSGDIEKALNGLGAFVGNWHLHGYSAESVGVGFAAGSDWSLTKSETKWLIHAIDGDKYNFDGIRRTESPDFKYEGDIGIEVKSNKNYSISRKQLHAIAEMTFAYVYLVTRTRVEVLDTFDWIGMNEYETDR